MTGKALVASTTTALSVPADAPRRSKPDGHPVRVYAPERVLQYAEQAAKAEGATVEDILRRLLVAGIEVLCREPTTGPACPDGRPHKRGTINTRYCARCGASMEET